MECARQWHEEVMNSRLDEKEKNAEEALNLALFRGHFLLLPRHEQEDMFRGIAQILKRKRIGGPMQGAILHVMCEIMMPTQTLLYEALQNAACLAHAQPILEVMYKVFLSHAMVIRFEDPKLRLVYCLLQHAESNLVYLDRLLLSDNPPPISMDDLELAMTTVDSPHFIKILLFHYRGPFRKNFVRRNIDSKQWFKLQLLITDTNLPTDPLFMPEWREVFQAALQDKEYQFLQTLLYSPLGRHLTKEFFSRLLSETPDYLVIIVLKNMFSELTKNPVLYQEILWAVSKKGHLSCAEFLTNHFPPVFRESRAFLPLGWKKFLFACLLLAGKSKEVFDFLGMKKSFCLEDTKAIENLTFFDLALIGGNKGTLDHMFGLRGKKKTREYLLALLKTQEKEVMLLPPFLWIVGRDGHDSFVHTFRSCEAPAETWIGLAQRVIKQSLSAEARKCFFWASRIVATCGGQEASSAFFRDLVCGCLYHPQNLWAFQSFCEKVVPNLKSWHWNFLVPLFEQLWHEGIFFKDYSTFEKLLLLLQKIRVYPLSFQYGGKGLLQIVSSIPNAHHRRLLCTSLLATHTRYLSSLSPFLRQSVEDFVLQEFQRKQTPVAVEVITNLPKAEACKVILRGPILYAACQKGETLFIQNILSLAGLTLSRESLYKLMLVVCTRAGSEEISTNTDLKRKATLAYLATEWRLRGDKTHDLVDATQMLEEAARAGCWHVLAYISRNQLFTFNLPTCQHPCFLHTPRTIRPAIFNTFCSNLQSRTSDHLTLLFASLSTLNFNLLQFDTIIDLIINYCF